jgi:hypothetical protein
MAAVSVGGVKVAHAATGLGGGVGLMKLKQYKELSASQKLATTPLYYVCNSRGNSYLQEDVQVCFSS